VSARKAGRSTGPSIAFRETATGKVDIPGRMNGATGGTLRLFLRVQHDHRRAGGAVGSRLQAADQIVSLMVDHFSS
jgi:hypothetical protein